MPGVRGNAECASPRPSTGCREVETDEFSFNFTITEKPHVQNDTVTLHKRFAQVCGRGWEGERQRHLLATA